MEAIARNTKRMYPFECEKEKHEDFFAKCIRTRTSRPSFYIGHGRDNKKYSVYVRIRFWYTPWQNYELMLVKQRYTFIEFPELTYGSKTHVPVFKILVYPNVEIVMKIKRRSLPCLRSLYLYKAFEYYLCTYVCMYVYTCM